MHAGFGDALAEHVGDRRRCRRVEDRTDEGELLLGGDVPLVLQHVPDILVRVRDVLSGSTALEALLGRTATRSDGTVELGLGESEPLHALELVGDGLNGIVDAAATDIDGDLGCVEATHERRRRRTGTLEGSNSTQRFVVEAGRDHLKCQPLQDRMLLIHLGRLDHHRVSRQRERDADEPLRQLRVADDLDASCRRRLDEHVGPRRTVATRRRVTKSVDDPRLDLLGIDLAHHDHRCQVRPVPVVVEPTQVIRRDRLDRLLSADRTPTVVVTPGEMKRRELVEHATVRRLTASSPLVEHDAPLRFDVVRVDRRERQPLLEDVEPGFDDLIVVRNRQLVGGLVIARTRVDVRPEPGPETAQDIDELVLRETLGAVEEHVLQEVCTTELTVVLEHGSRIDSQSQLGLPARVVVVADQVAEPVVECAGQRVGVRRRQAGKARRRRRGDRGRR